MGCGHSNSENRQALHQQFIDIELLNKPRTLTESNGYSTNFNTNNNFNNSSRESSASASKASQFSPFQTQLIEHTTLSVLAAPELESSRQQKFTECFSHIDASTFQNLPIMSMSHVGAQSLDMNVLPSQQLEDYFRFLDQVITTVVKPLDQMKIEDRTPLSLLLDA
ncbi:hypothetical protein TRFO_42313 [Tritrichomonas foetus]|uniref:Uncharacterized protein n=1 Tax=Tritrichomonas foetus TaxID=1144522 RepID=A0A1J4KX49_9EUKA|nr:hypothetical protein TRFO_42313 [Tritrichomonas foetus]|eukprot:OHT15754.1 hypothetical protein TRFO_42313 [Tritrichomonas foetus]